MCEESFQASGSEEFYEVLGYFQGFVEDGNELNKDERRNASLIKIQKNEITGKSV